MADSKKDGFNGFLPNGKAGTPKPKSAVTAPPKASPAPASKPKGAWPPKPVGSAGSAAKPSETSTGSVPAQSGPILTKKRGELSGLMSKAGSSGSAGGLSKKLERRRTLPTSELWKQNMKALSEAGVRGCRMRYSLAEGHMAFMASFQERIPAGKFNLLFPFVDKAELMEAGWQRFLLTVDVAGDGELGIHLRGRFELEQVPLDIDFHVLRTIGSGMGIGRDELTHTDSRTAKETKTSLKDVLNLKLKDGTPRFARKGDTVRDLPVEGLLSVLGRYIKDVAGKLRYPR